MSCSIYIIVSERHSEQSTERLPWVETALKVVFSEKSLRRQNESKYCIVYCCNMAVESIAKCRQACGRMEFCCKENKEANDTDYTCISIPFVKAMRDVLGQECRAGSLLAVKLQKKAKNQRINLPPGMTTTTTTAAPGEEHKVTSYHTCADVCSREEYCCFPDMAALRVGTDYTCKTSAEGKLLEKNGQACWPGSQEAERG
ncbi:unnamed protein product [Owenia fusiformis]|uniref:Uncharacterized protein n=1 Tax=Owenia fusiformis TaxID=6347 RepID=A0A8S4NAR2_OWEFU|nr:unnamed protein product [Owenia fusiformis]